MVIGFVILIVLLKFVGYGEILQSLALVNVGFLILMLGTKVLSLFIFNYKAFLLCKNIKPISFWKLLPIHLSGALVNNLTPGPSVGGEPVKAYFLEKATGMRGSKCFGLFTTDSLIFLVGTVIFMSLSTFYLIFSISFRKLAYFLAGWFAIFIILSILMVLFIFKISRNKERMDRFLVRIYKFRLFKFIKKKFKTPEIFVKSFHSKQKAFMGTIKTLMIDKRTVLKVLGASLIWYPLQALGLWFLLSGMGLQVSFIRLVAVTTVSMSLGFIIFVPGGTGAVESAIILLMSLLGVPASAITAAVLLDRAAYYIMTYVFGYLALSYVSMIYTAPGKMIKKLDT
tara:strand:- start:1299 stop:2321 length:1023 start_codon:yes stop_codon:yes gene_type:complete